MTICANPVKPVLATNPCRIGFEILVPILCYYVISTNNKEKNMSEILLEPVILQEDRLDLARLAIDSALACLVGRELISADEATNTLLDVRNILAADATYAEA